MFWHITGSQMLLFFEEMQELLWQSWCTVVTFLLINSSIFSRISFWHYYSIVSEFKNTFSSFADYSDLVEPEADSAYNSTSLTLDFYSHHQLHLDKMSISVDRPDLGCQKNRKVFKPLGSQMPTDEISLTQNTELWCQKNDELFTKRKSNPTQTNVWPSLVMSSEM